MPGHSTKRWSAAFATAFHASDKGKTGAGRLSLRAVPPAEPISVRSKGSLS